MSSGLITRFLGQGLAASRPADPDIAAGAMAFWWSTDTNEMSAWVESAWLEDILSGGGLAPGLDDGTYGDIVVSSGGTLMNIGAGTVGATELAATAVGAGSYTNANITVDADGRITAAANGSGGGIWYAGHVPLAADLPTLVNQDGTNLTMTDDADVGLLLDCGVTGSTDDIRAALKALPAAGSNWTLTIRLSPTFDAGGANNGVGMILRESATDKIMNFGALYGNGVDGYRGTKSAYTLGIVTTPQVGQFPRFFRCAYLTGANTYTFYTSTNGKQWGNVTGAIAAATPFTTRADQIGLGFVMNSAGKQPYGSCDYWVQSW